jgi:hypothetical protein
MSMDPNATEPFAPQTPAKSGGSKVWMFLGIGCGLMLLLCCGGGVGIYFVAKDAVSFTQAPEEVKQHAAQIADFEPPEGFTPDLAFNMNVPFTGQKIGMVIFTAPGHEGGITLMEIGQLGAEVNREDLQRQMEQSLNQQGRQLKKLTVLDTREVEIEIRGQPSTFKIQNAEDPQSKQRYLQVEGTFQGKQGTAVLVGQLKADRFSEEDAEKLVRSIK